MSSSMRGKKKKKVPLKSKKRESFAHNGIGSATKSQLDLIGNIGIKVIEDPPDKESWDNKTHQ